MERMLLARSPLPDVRKTVMLPYYISLQPIRASDSLSSQYHFCEYPAFSQNY
jgi:hypothetical protein